MYRSNNKEISDIEENNKMIEGELPYDELEEETTESNSFFKKTFNHLVFTALIMILVTNLLLLTLSFSRLIL